MSGVEPIALAALAGGTAANVMGQRQANKERRSITNRAFEDSQKTGDKATALVQAEGANFQGDKRMESMRQQEMAAFDQAQKDLTGAGVQGATLDTAGDQGNVSSAFMRSKADRALSEGDRLTGIARELAKTRAPGLTQQNEGMRLADTLQQSGSLWGGAKRRVEAGQLDAENVQEPWWGTVGKLAQQAALAYMGGGFGGAGAGGTAGATLTSGNGMAYIG